jgi:hypothetical protein
MSKIEPKVKHTPLKQSEKFWDEMPAKSITTPISNGNDVAELLKIIITKLDKIIDKIED